jgi:tetratricopeptide (TPR) repeat protein
MRLALLLLLALAGCADRHAHSPQTLFQQARILLRREHYQEARAQTELALRQAAPASPWYWKLRLLRVEILLEQRENMLARQALDFQLPSGPQWTGEWARYRLCQANIAYGLQRYAETQSHLDQARPLAAAIGAADMLAEIQLRRASLAMQAGDYDRAKSTLRLILDDALRRNDPYLAIKAKGPGHRHRRRRRRR